MADEHTNPENIKIIDVYRNEDLGKVEGFLKDRIEAYKKIYWSENTQTSDAAVGILLNLVWKSKDPCAKEIIKYLDMIKQTPVEEMDLEYIKQFDEITLYNQIIKIAENAKDPNIRELASMLIPELGKFMEIVAIRLGLKEKSKNGFVGCNKSQKQIIDKLLELTKTDTELSRRIKGRNFFKENVITVADKQAIQEILHSEYREAFIQSKNKIKGYDEKVPIFVRDKKGRICKLEEHPERTVEWKNMQIPIEVQFCIIPILKMKGWEQEQINRFIKQMKPLEYKEEQGKRKVNMAPFQVSTRVEQFFEEKS